MGILARLVIPLLVAASAGICGSGRVVDSLGVPVRGARVTRLSDTAIAATDRDGRWSFGRMPDQYGDDTLDGGPRLLLASSRLRVVVGGDRDAAGRRTSIPSVATRAMRPVAQRRFAVEDSIRIDAPGWMSARIPYDSSNNAHRTVLALASTRGMVAIQGGVDTLGSTANANNKPHVARLAGFWIDTVEVTQRFFDSLMGYDPSYHAGCSDCPVERVTWFDAVRFCNARSRAEGLPEVYDLSRSDSLLWGWDPALPGYRLPTDAEWEYAARAGASSDWYWGPYINKETVVQYAWYDQNSGDSTHQVGLLKPNAWGLYDVSGNVAEWTNDWFEDIGVDSQAYPKGPSGVQEWKTVRGGEFGSQNTTVIATWRPPSPPGTRWLGLGFRCARGVMP